MLSDEVKTAMIKIQPSQDDYFDGKAIDRIVSTVIQSAEGVGVKITYEASEDRPKWKRTEQALEINADGITTDMPVVIKVEVD